MLEKTLPLAKLLPATATPDPAKVARFIDLRKSTSPPPIHVRPTAIHGDPHYLIVDGLHRYCAAKVSGARCLPAIIQRHLSTCGRTALETAGTIPRKRGT